MSNDIRSLITSGSRTKVSPRDATLNNNIETQNKQPLSSQTKKPVEESIKIDQEEASSSRQIEKLETELSQLPENGKRLAVHLEKELRNELVSYCNQEEITPETFVEASLVILKQHPELRLEIANEARSRLLLRKRAGFIRRTISMLKGI
ncbi:MAG: hypothetical protein QNJ53_31110 [Pleurocapsa sp. MO_192.B19]|nr:hypothetical protein [Pleurocapsa sp. MO_192.B19]